MDVTVIIPAFDEGPLLLEAVESVLAQEGGPDLPLPRFEVIVVHDRGSDPATLAVLEDLRRRHPEVRILANQGRKGVAGSRNTAVAHATGEWVAFLDGDDLWYPLALAERYSVLSAAPDVDWVASDFVAGTAPDLVESTMGAVRRNKVLRRLLGWNGGPEPADPQQGPTLRVRRPVPQFCRASLCWTGTVMARRSTVVAVGWFNERLARDEDTNLWIRLADVSDLVFVTRPLAFRRVRPSTLARRGATLRGWDILGTLDLLRRPKLWRWFGPLYRTRLVRMMNEQAGHLRREKRFAAAAAWSLASGLAFPFQTRPWRNLAASAVRRG
jgi:glycosyltransferase involved in cell wall biosynthesis